MEVLNLIYHGVVYSKKNSKRIVRNRRTGQMSLIPSEAAQANARDMVFQFQGQVTEKIKPPCDISIEIYEPNYTRRDLDNQATSILDALKEAGIIQDDNFKWVKSLSIAFAGIDKRSPRAEITIREVENGQESHENQKTNR